MTDFEVRLTKKNRGEERLAWINKTNPHLKVDNALVANGNLKSLLLTSTLLAPVGYNPSNDSDPLGVFGRCV